MSTKDFPSPKDNNSLNTYSPPFSVLRILESALKWYNKFSWENFEILRTPSFSFRKIEPRHARTIKVIKYLNPHKNEVLCTRAKEFCQCFLIHWGNIVRWCLANLQGLHKVLDISRPLKNTKPRKWWML